MNSSRSRRLLAAAAAVVSVAGMSLAAAPTPAVASVPPLVSYQPLNLGNAYFDGYGGATASPVCMAPYSAANGAWVHQVTCGADAVWVAVTVNGSRSSLLVLANTIPAGALTGPTLWSPSSANLCLDTANGSTASGTPIVVGRCNWSSATQGWDYDSAAQRWSSAAGCLTGYAAEDANHHYNDYAFPCASDAANQVITPVYRTATIVIEAGVTLTATGTDVFGNAVSIAGQSLTLLPGRYTLTSFDEYDVTCDFDPSRSRGTYKPSMSTGSWPIAVTNAASAGRYNDNSTYLVVYAGFQSC